MSSLDYYKNRNVLSVNSFHSTIYNTIFFYDLGIKDLCISGKVTLILIRRTHENSVWLFVYVYVWLRKRSCRFVVN